MATGVLGFFALSAQTSFGTATTSFEFVPMLSEGMNTEIEALTEGGMRNRFAENPTHEGLETIAGDVVFEPDYYNVGHFLKGLFGQSSSGTTGTGSGTLYTHIFTPVINTDFDEKTALLPYTVDIFRDVTSSFRFTDTVFNTMNLEVTAGQIAQMTVGMMAKDTSIVSKETASFGSSLGTITWNVASIAVESGTNTIMENISISYDNQVEGIPFIDGTKQIGKFKRTGPQMVRVSGTLDFENLTEFNEFKTQSERRLFITLDDTGVESLNVLTVDIPKLRYETFPVNIAGFERITVDFEARGVYDTNSNYAIQMILHNSRTNGY